MHVVRSVEGGAGWARLWSCGGLRAVGSVAEWAQVAGSGHVDDVMRAHHNLPETTLRFHSCYGGVYKSSQKVEKVVIPENPLSRGNSCIFNNFFQLKRNLGGAAKIVVFSHGFFNLSGGLLYPGWPCAISA